METSAGSDGTGWLKCLKTAFSTPVGEISEPVLSVGWHIIKPGLRSTEDNEEVMARHILIKMEPVCTHMKAQSAQVSQTKWPDSAAAEMNLKVEESSVFQAKDAFIPHRQDAGLVSFAFDNPEGALADMFTSPSGTFLLEVSGVYRVWYPTFEDERGRMSNAAAPSADTP